MAAGQSGLKRMFPILPWRVAFAQNRGAPGRITRASWILVLEIRLTTREALRPSSPVYALALVCSGFSGALSATVAAFSGPSDIAKR
jgi:hypothetical protein